MNRLMAVVLRLFPGSDGTAFCSYDLLPTFVVSSWTLSVSSGMAGFSSSLRMIPRTINFRNLHLRFFTNFTFPCIFSFGCPNKYLKSALRECSLLGSFNSLLERMIEIHIFLSSCSARPTHKAIYLLALRRLLAIMERRALLQSGCNG